MIDRRRSVGSGVVVSICRCCCGISNSGGDESSVRMRGGSAHPTISMGRSIHNTADLSRAYITLIVGVPIDGLIYRRGVDPRCCRRCFIKLSDLGDGVLMIRFIVLLIHL